MNVNSVFFGLLGGGYDSWGIKIYLRIFIAFIDYKHPIRFRGYPYKSLTLFSITYTISLAECQVINQSYSLNML